MFPHTTEFLAKLAGVSPPTIHEWRRLGLFEGVATTKQGGNRRGVRCLWAPEAEERVREIVRLKGEGYDMKTLIARFAPKRGKDRKGERIARSTGQTGTSRRR